jgi:uncharacterized protein (DUF1015 family)
MVAIAPFRALRYSLEAVGDAARVIAPPYDVISPEQQEQLYAASPYNVVRVILAKDAPDGDRYVQAQHTFEAWRRDQVLRRDPSPAVYLYEHGFTWQNQRMHRLGFLALLNFEGSLPGGVLAHEATFDGPKSDRSRLLDMVKAHLSPVFCILPDADRHLDAWMRRASGSRPPEISTDVPFKTAGGNGAAESVRLWKIDDAVALAQLQAIVQPTKALIADGHHRFGAALSRRHLCPAVMTFFARMDDPGLIVRPYHRTLGQGGAGDDGRRSLAAVFDLQSFDSLATLQERLDAAPGPGWFGLYGDGRYVLAGVKPARLQAWLAAPTVPAPVARLDVSILHQAVLPLLDARLSGHVRYTPDIAHAVQEVDAGRADWGVLTRAIPLPEIFAIASAGHVLPQKSTYFYPKVLSGLLFNAFEA